MATLVLVRHGESQWNLENRFTGWVDVPLSEKGVNEAKSAGAESFLKKPFTAEQLLTTMKDLLAAKAN